MSPYSNVTIVNEDILKANVQKEIDQHLKDCDKIMLVANLPYYITTPILMNLLENDLPIDGFVVMMQKEVGERLNAKVGSKSYGSLSIACQYYTETERVLVVPKTVFMPPPNVDSIVIKLTKRTKPVVEVDDEQKLFKLTKGAFTQRRKTILNNYISTIKDGKVHKDEIIEWLNESNIDPKRRGKR